MSARSEHQTLEPSCTEVLDQLEEIMRGQETGLRQLGERLAEKRSAIAAADLEAITRLCNESHAISRSLAQLETCRLTLVGQLTEHVNPEARAPLTVSEMSTMVTADRGTRLRTLASALRQELDRVTAISAVVREAAESLTSHLAGLVQGLVAALSQSGVYSRRGGVASGHPDRRAIDVKT
jgi:hypothetical protein